jgi:hypothetical protein
MSKLLVLLGGRLAGTVGLLGELFPFDENN